MMDMRSRRNPKRGGVGEGNIMDAVINIEIGDLPFRSREVRL